MKTKALTCEEIYKQRITVKNVIRFLEAIPVGTQKSSDQILTEMREWLARDSERRKARKAKQEASRAIHPTIIARTSSSDMPEGIETMTIKVKPLKEKKP